MRGRDDGSAMVEFSVLAILLMVPLAYVILTIFRIQASAYAVTTASRQAGRAFVTSVDESQGRSRAATASALSMRDFGLDPGRLTIICDQDPCLTPGGRIEIRIDVDVSLPFLPPILAGRAPASVAIHAEHVEIVDPYG